MYYCKKDFITKADMTNYYHQLHFKKNETYNVKINGIYFRVYFGV